MDIFSSKYYGYAKAALVRARVWSAIGNDVEFASELLFACRMRDAARRTRKTMKLIGWST